MTRKTIALCLCVLGLATPAALAQTPSQTGYGETPVLPPPQSGAAGESNAFAPAAPAAGAKVTSASTGAADSNTGSLPFTGMDIGVIALMAALLLGAGVGLRRATASRSTS